MRLFRVAYGVRYVDGSDQPRKHSYVLESEETAAFEWVKRREYAGMDGVPILHIDLQESIELPLGEEGASLDEIGVVFLGIDRAMWFQGKAPSHQLTELISDCIRGDFQFDPDITDNTFRRLGLMRIDRPASPLPDWVRAVSGFSDFGEDIRGYLEKARDRGADVQELNFERP